MAGTNYRVDRVTKSPDPVSGHARVPAGMNSIVYLDDKPPSIGNVMHYLRPVLRKDEQLLFSKWDTTFKEYVISQVVNADSN